MRYLKKGVMDLKSALLESLSFSCKNIQFIGLIFNLHIFITETAHR